MRKSHITLAGVAAGLSIFASQQSQALTLGFANDSHSAIQFNGNSTFDFARTAGNPLDQFIITSSNGAGDSVSDQGNITGLFTIGTVSGGQAAVTGSGALTIYGPNAAAALTGTIVWNTISYDSSGTLNVSGILNLTGLSYSGSQLDLQAMAASGTAEEKVTFTFTDPLTLSQLKTSAVSTTYAGVIQSTPDGGLTLLLLGIGLTVLGWRYRQSAA
jgi:hypothetical protein